MRARVSSVARPLLHRKTRCANFFQRSNGSPTAHGSPVLHQTGGDRCCGRCCRSARDFFPASHVVPPTYLLPSIFRAARPHSLMRTASCVSRAFSATRSFSSRVPARRAPASRTSSTAVAASMAETKRPYPIGTPGVPWTDDEKKQWRASVESPARSYQEEVLAKIEALRGPNFDVQRYGALPYDESDPCLLYTSPSPRDATLSRMPSSA